MVWSAGVDTQYFSPAGDGKKTDGPCLVICVSNFYLRSKRQDLVLRIFAELVKSVRQARLVFVGRGTYENHCKQLAEGLGIAGSVDFMGLRSRDQVLELLRTAKVFLSCSETEGLPNVLLEAQAVGVPVVASDIPAHREALAAELFPYLFKSDALHEAANSIKRIVLDPELRWSLARAGRQHVLNHYDGSRCLLTLENWYKLWTGAARQEHASD
jgi:glycosyltransferase involved in cell wall biosynthesis